MKHGADLCYASISETDAPVLRRMLNIGPPVRELFILSISMADFEVVFDGLGEFSGLKKVCVSVDCENNNIGRTLPGALRIRSLHTLELSCHNTGTGFARAVADFIRQIKTLRNLYLRNSCGGDEKIAVIIEALAVNDTLRRFRLREMELSSDTFIVFAEMLATNLTLQLVNLNDVCPVEKDKVRWLLAHNWHALVFERLEIVWPEHLLPELIVLIREGACPPQLSISITSSVDKKILWKLFLTVGVQKKLEGLTFVSINLDDSFSELAEGIASLVKYTRTLRRFEIRKHIDIWEEPQLLVVLDALKKNSSVIALLTSVHLITPEVAASLSELFEVNNTLISVELCDCAGVLSTNELETILRGLKTNYTLNKLWISEEADEPEEMREVDEILARNIHLKNQAAEFVMSGAHRSDKEGADALKKVRLSAALVERVKQLTGMTTEAVLREIQSILARLRFRRSRDSNPRPAGQQSSTLATRPPRRGTVFRLMPGITLRWEGSLVQESSGFDCPLGPGDEWPLVFQVLENELEIFPN
ncbi:hypothetical protein HPB51_029247 [Rhipicephalus microplus]|uniref:Uncharacterized protein n=1 Tax=Rhipicephalus microplus TaxID=6941 RepID=A0A9J6CUS8_RHIMP|nr:hypothetical protein HPB51_029247 [Rhipicephalus microplus]